MELGQRTNEQQACHLCTYLGADPPVLPAHVAVQGVPRLGHRATQDAPVARAHRVFIFHVSAQGVS